MKAVVYGGGNIGRGFLGQLLYESGYETVFVDVNQELIDKLNTDKSYPIKIVCNEFQKEILIKNVRAVHSYDAVDEIATADIIFTSAGVNVLPYIAQRKLAPKDRLLGALSLCQKHHIPTDNIKRGIIAALDYIYEEEN